MTSLSDVARTSADSALTEFLSISHNDDGTLKNGGSSSAVTKSVTQIAHGFSVGNAIRFNGTSWVASKADAAANADVDGLVSAVADADNFTVSLGGDVTGMSGLTAGQDYFLDPSTAGALTTAEPSTAGQVSVPVVKAISTTESIFRPLRGLVIPAKAITYIPIQVGSESAALAAGEGIAHWTIMSLLAGKSLVSVAAQCSVAPSTTGYNIQLRKNGTQAGVGGTDILSTALTIDTTKVTSDASATQPVIKSDGTQTFAQNDIIFVDCDQGDAGNGRGLTILMGIQ